MNLLTAILALSCLFPQDTQKPLPPTEDATNEQKALVQGLQPCVDTFDPRAKDMTSALDFGQKAAKENDNTKAWALYQLAVKHADGAGEARICHQFAIEMAERWKVPPDFLSNWHIKAVQWSSAAPTANNEARISELAQLMFEDVEKLEPEDYSEGWESAFKALRKLAADSESQHTKRFCNIKFAQIKAWLWVAKEAANESVNAMAFRQILMGDVPAGIQTLAKSDDKQLAKEAQSISEDDASFSDAHLRLLQLLADSKFEAARISGQRIFESLLPVLSNDQIETCQPICFHMTEQLPLRADFSLPNHGQLKNGYHPSAQEKKISKGFSFDEEKQHWSCKGNGTVEWPRLPFENYVQETELTIDKIADNVHLAFGSEDSAQVRFWKDGDKIMARLIRRVGGRYNWKGSRKFAVGEKLKVKVYRTPERMFAFINGKKMNSRYFGLGWHKFRITVEKGSQISVSSIKTRPWLPGDREVLSKLNGDHKSIDMTISKFRAPTVAEYQKYLAAFDGVKEVPESGESFVAMHEILMRPVASSRFDRPGDGRTVFISKDFHCSAHEITQRQFSEVMEYNPASAQGNPYLPVDNVTFAEAVEFCKRLTDEHAVIDLVPEGYQYRLPTEAEWTLAAMADGKSTMDVPEAECWHWGTCEGGFRMVGTSSPSDRGIYDMHGNVEELTLTKYSKRKKPSKETEELVDPASVPNRKSHIVIKGGSWNIGAHLATADKRERRHQGRTPGRGFRVVLAPVLED